MTAPNIDVRRVDRAHDPVLRNLFEHYLYDMAEWFGFESEPDGHYLHSTDAFWEPGIDVHLAYRGEIPIGFAIVAPADKHVAAVGGKELFEFFVVRRHRRGGIGRALAEHVWNAYPGSWLVRVYRGNLPALPFWRGVIDGYTRGAVREEEREVDGRGWSYFHFDNSES